MNIILSLPAYLIVFAFGASIGSFLNVVIYRIPAGLSVLHPPSRCPHCLTRLSPSENIPVFGWLWLQGRCKHCHAPISSRYPIVEATTGLLFLFIFLTFPTLPQILGYWVLFSWLIALSLIDLDTYTLPNILTQSGLILGLGFQLSQSLTVSSPLNNGLMAGVIGAVVGLWLFDIISFVGSLIMGQTAMGAGDSKLAAMMGAWLGWKYLLVAGFIGCLFGAIVGGGAIALGLISRRHPIPFGPFLALGAAITALWGDKIVSTYINLFFPIVK
jgi:leader peptidase (prepilin peptidase)/N-methyltransferase